MKYIIQVQSDIVFQTIVLVFISNFRMIIQIDLK